MKITHLAIVLGRALISTEAHADARYQRLRYTRGETRAAAGGAIQIANPGTTFDIAAEGSTTGIAAIIEGTAQIGMASRRAKPAEVGTAPAKA